ncbi:hypothetical protein KIW84_073496 [Lathyrus oleraceus]|uniref:Uncharacterized protein n=1 Tax=Pisum sativum TaxID=3888 RepID=A0A9D4VPB8_PEA|nr:hypothetical protein KIW84_073496 [Pisum sativum]
MCICGGINIITTCDIRVCIEDAFLSVKEVDLALVVDSGSLQSLQSIVGFGNLMELALTTIWLSGLEGKDLDLVSHVFYAQHQLNEGVREFAQGWDLTVDQRLYFVATLNSAILLSSDLVEAVAAVKQKWKPNYSKL